MRYGVRIVPAADVEVDELALFIAEDDLEAALRFYDAVESTYRRIADNPTQYQVYPLADPRLAGVRRAIVEGFPNHLIFYRVDGDMVEIIRVLHGARDLPPTLSGENKNDSGTEQPG
jgi:toxin ParE1/3/4